MEHGLALPDHPLPPTRAARPPRSRGTFFGSEHTHSRVGHRLINALCIVLAAAGIAATARFAEPILDGKFVSTNAGPALVASAMHASTLVPARPR